jgi:hypothetical protein
VRSTAARISSRRLLFTALQRARGHSAGRGGAGPDVARVTHVASSEESLEFVCSQARVRGGAMPAEADTFGVQDVRRGV